MQNIQSAPPAGTQPAQGAMPGSAPANDGGAAPGGGSPSQPVPNVAAAAATNPPLHETFEAGLRDFNAAKYSVATGEFQDVIHYYPMDELSGNSSTISAKSPTGRVTMPPRSMTTTRFLKPSLEARKLRPRNYTRALR